MGNKAEEELAAVLKLLGLSSPPNKAHIKYFDAALTHTSAGLDINHEKLEFLGDAVLRLACSEFLEQQGADQNVGERSKVRAQLVSDRWLTELASKIELSKQIKQGSAAASDDAT